jgi:uncharacterized protein YgiM (DUF1202 family)
MKMKIDKKQIAKLFTFAMFVGGATAIYLYVSKNKKEKPPLPPSPPSNEVYVNALVKTNTSDLNVREEPSTTSKIVNKLKKGTKILVSDDINGWRKVVDESKNTIGFVSSQYVALA